MNVDIAGVVQSIRRAAGPLVERTPAPAVADYFGLLIYPVFGFLVPWGSIRALTWVATRFFQPKPPEA